MIILELPHHQFFLLQLQWKISQKLLKLLFMKISKLLNYLTCVSLPLNLFLPPSPFLRLRILSLPMSPVIQL
jgi:hypothetical protein